MNIKSLWHKKGILWKYFRDGFGFVTLPLSIISFATTTYYLMIDNINFLKVLFPSFSYYIIIMTLVILPVNTFIGWLHYKRSGLFGKEQELAVTSNPISPYMSIIGYTNMLEQREALTLLMKDKGYSEKEIERVLPKATADYIKDAREFYEKLQNRWKWSPKK